MFQVSWVVVVNAFNPSTPETEVGGVQGQPGLQGKLQDSQGYTEQILSRKKQKKKRKNG